MLSQLSRTKGAWKAGVMFSWGITFFLRKIYFPAACKKFWYEDTVNFPTNPTCILHPYKLAA